jgi:ribosomal protein L11 methyltransferase
MSEQAPLQCVQITLPTADPIAQDVIEGALWEADLVSWECQDDETWSVLVEDPRPHVPGSVRWRVHTTDATSPEEALAWMQAQLPDIGNLELEAWEISDFSFLTAWKEFFRPTQISPRIMVCPPWDRREPASKGGIVVEIDPGMAFGTGTHETTRLCMQVIDRLMAERPSHYERVIDVGTGSGILAIAARKLGATTVYGTDNDPIAPPIATENAEINGITDCVFSTDTLQEVGATFDLVLANILPHVLIELRDDLVARIAEGGTIVLSGILKTEAPRVREAFGAVLGDSIQQDDMGEWCSLTWVG